MNAMKKIAEKIKAIYNRKQSHWSYEKTTEVDSYYFREGPIETDAQREEREENEHSKVSVTDIGEKYEVLEREIAPRKIICPDCGGITLEGLEFCDKCGGELTNRD